MEEKTLKNNIKLKSLILKIEVFVLAVFLISFMGADKMKIREPYVSGKFYEGNASKLSSYIDVLFEDAVPQKGGKLRGLIVPHAGYPYSGQIAADGFYQAKGYEYDFVVILGTNHTAIPQECGYLYDGDGFKTPLGNSYIDTKINEELSKKGLLFKYNNDAHSREHSIEVEIPFIQKLFPKAKIVPIVIAASSLESAEKIGGALSEVLRDKNFLVVASSDLSHYPDFDVANIVDKETLTAIATMDNETIFKTAKRGELKANVDTSACGVAPIMVLVKVMNELSSRRVSIISYANSGQCVIGETDRVVGYGAVSFCEGFYEKDVSALDLPKGSENISDKDREYLLKLARRTISNYLNYGLLTLPRFTSDSLIKKQGAFVTLTKKGDLRGCIGHMAEDTPLATTVAKMALSAALQDTRFYPVTKDELKEIEIEISVLTPMKEVKGPTDIVIGRDGTLIQKGGRSAVFLPQVAPEQGWGREEMLEHLCMKAGLSPDAYKSNCKFFTFQAIVFSEKHR